MFDIGAYVVKAGEGVCRIDSRVELRIPGGDGSAPYFLLVPLSDPKIRVYLPVTGEHSDVRAVMSADEAEALIRKIPELMPLQVENEKIRETAYRDAVRSCDPERTVGVLKTLFARRRERTAAGKKPTALDERYLAAAEKALYSEIGFVLSLKNEEIRARIAAEQAIEKEAEKEKRSVKEGT